MSSVCFYFEVHQPYRVRVRDVHNVLKGPRASLPFDEDLNRQVMQKVASKCYLPANEAMLRLIERYKGRFRVAYAITGVALEQMRSYAPEVIESFQRLVRTGAVEILGETYYHSLSVLYDEEEFAEQVRMHRELMQTLFDVTPQVFRNTELIYDDRIGRIVSELGFQGMLAEGPDDVIGWRSPNFVYHIADYGPTEDGGAKYAAAHAPMGLLLKNYRLSDDIAFRFSNRGWEDFPLTADKFAGWVHRISGNGDVLNLFMDYETFGEHQWRETGIFEFLSHLPEAVLAHADWDFRTPSEVLAHYPKRAPMHFARTTSWADMERDLTAWCGNEMQGRAIARLYALGVLVKQNGNPALLEAWRKLTTSDHVYYMSTKFWSDGDVHAYFSPYESPYAAFMHFIDALRDIEAAL